MQISYSLDASIDQFNWARCLARLLVRSAQFAVINDKHSVDLAFLKEHNNNMKKRVVTSSPDVMGGTPVFAGTRVPVQTLFDYLVAGDSIDNFLEGFPTVKKKQIIALLEGIKKPLLRKAA